MIKNLDKFEFVTSFLTKAEIGREMISAFGLNKEEIEHLWKTFIETLKCKVIERFEFNMKLADLATSFKMKLRTLINFQHLFIAMKEEVYFVTGDKDIVKIARLNRIYEKILTYIELRKMVT
jgi:HSP90 family molecular chaperone